MNSISAQIITFFLSACFALAGVFNYLVTDKIWPLLWISSFICLLATVGLDVVDRIIIERRVKQLTGDERLPFMLRRQDD